MFTLVKLLMYRLLLEIDALYLRRKTKERERGRWRKRERKRERETDRQTE